MRTGPIETVTKLFDRTKTVPCAASELATNPLSQVTKNGLTRFSGRLWHASRWRRERISNWTRAQRQELGDEVIVANVRELRAKCRNMDDLNRSMSELCC